MKKIGNIFCNSWKYFDVAFQDVLKTLSLFQWCFNRTESKLCHLFLDSLTQTHFKIVYNFKKLLQELRKLPRVFQAIND